MKNLKILEMLEMKQKFTLKNKHLNSSAFYNGSMIAQKYGFKLSPDFIYLIEAIKVEGYWSYKTFTLTIQNKNLPFLRRVENITKSLGIKPSKRVLLKIKLNENYNKEDITLYSNVKLNFHLEKSPFDGSKKVVTSLSYQEDYNIKVNINDKSHILTIKYGKEELEINSELRAWAYLDLRFPKAKLLKFLSEYLENNKKARIQNFLFNADKKYVASAFSALIDAEGNLTHHKLFRTIRIRMRNKQYLKDWKVLLAKFDIDSRFSKNTDVEYGLVIEGWEDFDKLQKLGVKFYHSKKARKFEEILKSYKRKQVSRGSAYKFYIQKLKEIEKPVTAREFAEKLGKSKRVTNHYLTRLMKKSLIKVDKSKVAYLYSNK